MMSVKSKAICLMISMLLLAPAALGEIVIINGPNVEAASNGAIAAGGQYLITDPTGDAQDGVYWAVMGLHAFAAIPSALEGYATVNFQDQQSTFDKTIDLWPDIGGFVTHGDKPHIQLSYEGDVSANVWKTRPTNGVWANAGQPGNPAIGGPAIAYANIGSGAADIALPNFAGDADDNAIGASGMLSFLYLPQYASGNAGTDGIARFAVTKIGDSQNIGGQSYSDESLEIQGITNGCTGISGVGDRDANNQVLGIAALGTLVAARDVAFPYPPVGEEGQSISATGMFTLTGAATNPFTPTNQPTESPDADVQAKVTSRSTTGGAWDGSTPITTTKQAGVNDNVRSTVTGSINSVAETYQNGDIAASGALLGDINFHVASPFTTVPEFAPILGPLAQNPITFGFAKDVVGVDEALAAQDTTMAALKDYMANGGDAGIESTVGEMQSDLASNAGSALTQTGYQMDNQLNPYLPQFDFSVGQDDSKAQVGVLGPDMVALDIAATGAVARRTQYGPFTDYVTAEAYITNGQASSLTTQIDRKVSVEKKDLNMASGAHIRNGRDFVGSIGYAADIAAQDYNIPIFPTTGLYGTGSIYGAVTLAPPASGDRWDDAGSYMKLKSATMESRMGSKYVRQTDGPIDEITWMAGNDMNPRIKGQNIPSTIQDSISGNPSVTSQLMAPLIYLEWPNGRAAVWNTATGTLQI